MAAFCLFFFRFIRRKNSPYVSHTSGGLENGGKMSVPTLATISDQTITSERIRTRVLFSGQEDGIPVLLLHGNFTSATWCEEIMLSLPDGYRGIAPDQRGFGDTDPKKKIDATRGMSDLADDAIALLDHLGIDKAHILGLSLGGSVLWRMLMDAPQRFLTATQVAPGSPYGFGGTKDVSGTPCYDDYAGAGGGLVNPELVKLVEAGDRGLESQFSPRAALRALVFKPPFVPEREEDLLSSAMSIHMGPQDWPGDVVVSPNWPFITAGEWGAANALSPKYAGDIEMLYAAELKPKILWLRGSHDLTVSDSAAADPGTLGAMGLIPGWPGAEVYPSQPMVGQTRAVLEKYAATGGSYHEVVMNDVGHAPFIEDLAEFNRHFHAHILG
jgi:pimeloyl-ACP methyl ester carboxylesterase